MILSTAILGKSDDSRFAGRKIEVVLLDANDSAKRKLRRRTDAGTDVGIDLARGIYLTHGAVLADDGERIIVVERRPERAMILWLDQKLQAETLLHLAARIGHAFGNQHVPLEVVGYEIRVPVTSSDEMVRRTVTDLHLHGLEIGFAELRLALHKPLTSAHAHD
jgi:urease accessory protein